MSTLRFTANTSKSLVAHFWVHERLRDLSMVSDGQGSDGGGVMTGISDRSVMKSGLGDNVGVVMSDNGSSLDLPDNGMTLNRCRYIIGNRFGHMDGSGHLNDPLDMFDHVIGNIVGLLNGDGLVNGVDLLLDLECKQIFTNFKKFRQNVRYKTKIGSLNVM